MSAFSSESTAAKNHPIIAVCSRNPTIYVVDRHDQVLAILRELDLSRARMLHLDFHCDLRGMLIDRRRQRAFRIWERFPAVDQGNFLTHAVFDGLIGGIRWVHDEPGGRRHDLKTVKYESDLTALWHRGWLRWQKDAGTPIVYEVLRTAEWKEIQDGELLDIDWDYFACREYPLDSIAQRVNRFLNMQFDSCPTHTFVCYSPDYSHSTREQFHCFVEALAEKFQADVDHRPLPVDAVAVTSRMQRSPLKMPFQLFRRAYRGSGLTLRRMGIY